MSSSDQLRRAATKLRETAAKATPGPWEFTPAMYDHGRGAITSASPTVVGWDALVIDVPNGSEHRAAEWMALMSPALAEPLAVWLEAIADKVGLLAPADQATLAQDENGHLWHALRLARVILGEAS